MTIDGSHRSMAALRAALNTAKPSVVAAALARRKVIVADTAVPEPEPGQCWLLRWDDTVTLALITRVHDDHLLVMPMDIDPSAADETALVVPGREAGFADDVAVFAMLETGIGPWVLDCLVTTLTQPEQTGALRGWLRKADAGSLPAGWREGTPTPHDAHPRRLARKDIAERISVLGEADWLSDGWSRNADSTTTAASPMPPHEVHAALGGTPQRAFAIARRDVEPTPEEAKRLREAGLNVRASQQPPVDVIHELDSPTQKAAVLTLATRRHATEGRTRQELAQHGLGLAARRNAQGVRSLSDQVLMLREAMRRELDG